MVEYTYFQIDSVTEERTIDDQSAVNLAGSDEQGMLMNNHANNNPCANDGQGCIDGNIFIYTYAFISINYYIISIHSY